MLYSNTDSGPVITSLSFKKQHDDVLNDKNMHFVIALSHYIPAFMPYKRVQMNSRQGRLSCLGADFIIDIYQYLDPMI